MKNITSTLGRILFALPFLVFGINHFLYAKGMAGIVPSFIPGGVIWVYITGVALVAASISIIAKKYIKVSTLLLALFLILMVILVHVPGLNNADKMVSMNAMVGLLKDLALAGAALYISGSIK
jgi:putative oxidoreductase